MSAVPPTGLPPPITAMPSVASASVRRLLSRFRSIRASTATVGGRAGPIGVSNTGRPRRNRAGVERGVPHVRLVDDVAEVLLVIEHRQVQPRGIAFALRLARVGNSACPVWVSFTVEADRDGVRSRDGFPVPRERMRPQLQVSVWSGRNSSQPSLTARMALRASRMLRRYSTSSFSESSAARSRRRSTICATTSACSGFGKHAS